ncbi:hypothetical protein B0A53_00688 [Rhodotorula sp. CCFEE 5036]|nr:hypothetical protein B0A53_00688 [Rhodotorula sp. CCFEE 5036]
MGVHGLWTLLQPVARPVTLETLKDKRLAIDASMWLYQFQMATRDRNTGDVIYGAHIMGTFRRIMKLLFYGVKPVFVFDGDAPTLKKRTIEQRKRRKQGAGRDLAKTAQELLAAQLRSAAAEREIARRKERIAAAEAGAEKSDDGDEVEANQPASAKKPVYLDDLNKPVSPIKPRRDVLRDDYALPRIEGPLESRAKPSDPRIATEAELRDFLDDLRPEDLDLNSKFFGDLPTEVKYEIIGDLRIKTRQVNHRRVQQMRGTAAIDFSKAQIEHLMERNSYTQKLLSITDELGKSAIAIPTRVAGQRNREYVLMKQDASKGGGWVLGVKNPEISNTQPIVIESTTDESVDERTDTDEFEEVGFDSPEKPTVGLPTPDVEARRILAEEAIFARVNAKSMQNPLDPYLDQPAASTSTRPNLFHADEMAEGVAGEEDPALQQALYDSAAATGSADIFVKVPLPPVAAQNTSAQATGTPALDSDDELEYVDVTPSTSRSAPPLHAPAPRKDQITLSDSEGSDAFEEVGVGTNGPKTDISGTVTTSADPSRTSRPASRAASPPQPDPSAAPVRSLLDSILPSDSESDDDEHSPRTKSRQLPSPRKPPPVAPPRLSPSPDPFERYERAEEERPRANEVEESGGRVQSTDFAVEDAKLLRRSSPSPQHDGTPSQGNPAPSDTRGLYHAQLERQNPTVAENRKSPSPSDLPTVLPPSEKALSAIETDEMAALPNVLAAMPSPEITKSHDAPPPPPNGGAPATAEDPPIQYLEDLELAAIATPLPPPAASAPPQDAASSNTKSKGKAKEVVQYLEDLENPTPGRPAPVNIDAGAEDEEFFSDWSRSPSPRPPRGAEKSAFDRQVERTYEDDPDDEEEAALAMMREEGAYADVMAQLRNNSVEAMRLEAEREVARLSAQKRAEMRNADGVTRQMAIDIREMLVLFGIPFVDAPSEAEAECASLLERQLVDGIVTDDSDVFLFGGSRIYRNMFNEAKYVECYLLSDLEREIGLDRSKLVRLAYLLGSDYTEGLPGVGVVAGRELLEEFPGDDGLIKFRHWWDKVQKGIDTPEDTNTTWKKRFKSGHRQLVLDQGWPSAEVRQAYYRPVVDDSEERFSWGSLDLDGLRMYLHRSLGWGQAKSDEILLPLIKREQERKEGKLKSQAMVTDFFDYSAGEKQFMRKKQPKYASKRLQNVVQAWKDRSQSPRAAEQGKFEELADEDDGENGGGAAVAAAPKKRKRASKAKPAGRKKSTAASRRRAEKEQRDARAAANGGVYSSEEEFNSDNNSRSAPTAGPSRVQPARKKRKALVATEPISDVDTD